MNKLQQQSAIPEIAVGIGVCQIGQDTGQNQVHGFDSFSLIKKSIIFIFGIKVTLKMTIFEGTYNLE